MAFDPRKDALNVARHGISLGRAFDMDLDLTITFPDRRFGSGEDRFISIGPIDAELYVLAHTYRDEEIRPISLRRAEKAEKKLYRESW
jgi:uncharacterized protein